MVTLYIIQYKSNYNLYKIINNIVIFYFCSSSPYICHEITVNVPVIATSEINITDDINKQLSPKSNSVLSGDNEADSFADCECLDELRTDSLSDEKLPFKDAELGIECSDKEKEPAIEFSDKDKELCVEPSTDVCESGTSELGAVIVSTIDKLKTLDSIESVISDTDSFIGSRSNSDLDAERRTSVIDPPSGFQTSTPSSKEDLVVYESEPNKVTEIIVTPTITSWTRSGSKGSTKLQRGSSIEVCIFVIM